MRGQRANAASFGSIQEAPEASQRTGLLELGTSEVAVSSRERRAGTVASVMDASVRNRNLRIWMANAVAGWQAETDSNPEPCGRRSYTPRGGQDPPGTELN